MKQRVILQQIGQKQSGFLIMAAAVIIVIFGLIAAFLVSMLLRSSEGTIYLGASTQAEALAESGLQQGAANLTDDILATRQTCTGLSATQSISTGSFNVTAASDAANLVNPRYAFATLSGGITAGATPTTLTVNDSSVFAPQGRVLIGREVFRYARIANAITLAGVVRAQDTSVATVHPSGALVSQYQCMMDSIGSAPGVAPFGVRQYQQGMQAQTLFAVGNNGRITRWNTDTNELAWQDDSPPGAQRLNGVSVLNYHDVWAVGDRQNASNYFLVRLQGNTWSTFTVPGASPLAQNLQGVHTTSEYEAWAVGIRAGTGGSRSFNLLRWVRDGSNSNNNWCKLPNQSLANGTCASTAITVNETGIANKQKFLYSVVTRDTNNDGFANYGLAVGGQDGARGGARGPNRGVVLQYNGTQWTPLTLLANQAIGRLYGVALTPNGTSEAFFVGRSSGNNSQGKLVRLRSGVWTVVTTTRRMYAVSVIDTDGDGIADFGCAVGDAGQIITFDSNGILTNVTLSGNQDFLGVSVISPTDIWAVRSNGSAYHYDGISWIQELPNTSGVRLNGVSGAFPTLSPVSSWHDVVN